MLEAKKIFCVGIGGSGVSALASILHKYGKNVSGSDKIHSEITKKLGKSGIKINIGHKEANLPPDTDLLIYSFAIKQDNPERIEAKNKGIPEMSYSKAIGELSKDKNTIAVSGTHGKTTVTSMLSTIFIAENKDPSVIVGSQIKEMKNRNHRLGKSNYLILEACEYCRNFLNYHPDIIIINNIEADHLDYFKDEHDYFHAFEQFARKLSDRGLLIINGEDKNCITLLKNIKKDRKDIQIITFGSQAADFRLINNTVYQNKKIIGRLTLQIPGRHNQLNALAAFSAAYSLGLDPTVSINALNHYSGAKRRFELLGKVNKTLIYDDYAHHPSEIKATLLAARQKFGKKAKIMCIFQPHQHSRTNKLKDLFAESFKEADLAVISDIFFTRDSQKDIASIDSAILTDMIKTNSEAIYGGDPDNTIRTVARLIQNFDVLITMGAGDINKTAHKLLTRKG